MKQGDMIQFLIAGSIVGLAFLVKDYKVTPYDREFRGAALRWNVPLNLLRAIGKRETGRWWGGVIPDGDQGRSLGVMQVQKSTAASSPYAGTDLRDPANGIGAGAWYLNELRKQIPASRFSLDAWIAGYNAGPDLSPFPTDYVAAVKQYYYLFEVGEQIA